MEKTLSKKQKTVYSAAAILVFLVLVYLGDTLIPMTSQGNMLMTVIKKGAIFALVAVSMNLLNGFTGLFSLGQAGFMLIGAYAYAIFSIPAAQHDAVYQYFNGGLFKFSVPEILMNALGGEGSFGGFLGEYAGIFILIIFAGLLTGGIAYLIGIPVLRLRGDYLAIVTLAFGEIIKNVINVLYIAKDENGFHFAISDGNKIELSEDGIWLINGAKGIAKIPHLSSFTAGVIMILVILFIVYNFVNSRTGRAVMAIRDNRIAAESVGINITKFKLMAFTISAAIAGAGGVLYAHNLSTVTATPTNFGYNMSIMILVFVVLGGMGSFRGSIIAAVILTLLPEVLRGLKDYRMLIYSIVLIAMMLFNWAPKCIEMRQRIAAKFKKPAKKEAA